MKRKRKNEKEIKIGRERRKGKERISVHNFVEALSSLHHNQTSILLDSLQSLTQKNLKPSISLSQYLLNCINVITHFSRLLVTLLLDMN